MIWYVYWAAIIALIALIGTVIARSMDEDTHRIIPAAEVERMENEHFQRLISTGKMSTADEEDVLTPAPEIA